MESEEEEPCRHEGNYRRECIETEQARLGQMTRDEKEKDKEAS